MEMDETWTREERDENNQKEKEKKTTATAARTKSDSKLTYPPSLGKPFIHCQD